MLFVLWHGVPYGDGDGDGGGIGIDGMPHLAGERVQSGWTTWIAVEMNPAWTTALSMAGGFIPARMHKMQESSAYLVKLRYRDRQTSR